MDRKDFLTTIGNTAALICVGCMASCVRETPFPSTSSTQFIVNLNNEIKNVGEFIIKGPIIILRVALGDSASSFAVLSTICTHNGFTVGYLTDLSNTKNGSFLCPGHGSTFTQNGTLIQGLAPRSLDKVPFSISGSSLIVNPA